MERITKFIEVVLEIPDAKHDGSLFGADRVAVEQLDAAIGKLPDLKSYRIVYTGR